MSFARKFGDKYGKKLIDTATKAGKATFKRVLQKPAGTTGDLIGNKIADKITSVEKGKSKEKKDETKKRQEIYIPP